MLLTEIWIQRIWCDMYCHDSLMCFVKCHRCDCMFNLCCTLSYKLWLGNDRYLLKLAYNLGYILFSFCVTVVPYQIAYWSRSRSLLPPLIVSLHYRDDLCRLNRPVFQVPIKYFLRDFLKSILELFLCTKNHTFLAVLHV